MCICCSLPSWSILKFDAIKMYSVLERFNLSLFAKSRCLTFSRSSFAIVLAIVLTSTQGFDAHMCHGGSRSDGPTAWDSNKNRDGVALSTVAVGRCVNILFTQTFASSEAKNTRHARILIVMLTWAVRIMKNWTGQQPIRARAFSAFRTGKK